MTTDFEILAAIDLLGGRAVRLEQGDFDRETTYSHDPADVAAAFVDGGARWLHVVDLDGARSGASVHGAVIEAIVSRVGDRVSVEVAGGLRSDESVAAMLRVGAARVVIGTAALRDPSFLARLIDSHGEDRVAVAIDVRDGRVVGEGWHHDASGANLAETWDRLAGTRVATFEVTAIDRDGLLGGPDLALYRRVVSLGRGAIIASAGVATVDDVAAVRAVGCRGVIIGRALYEGRFSLREALAVAAKDPSETLLSSRVRRRVERDYPGADHDQAVRTLIGVDLGTWRIGGEPAGRERIHAALLRLAHGDIRRLQAESDEAIKDWRDTLVAADMAGEDWRDLVDAELGPVS